MPIEFECESCLKLLKVPDGTEGRACECPACGELLTIPGPTPTSQRKVVTDEVSSNSLTVACPKCDKPLVCPAHLVGTKGQCRHCKSIFLITTDARASREVIQTNLVFHCPKCNQLFDGTEEMRGRKGKCHVCGEVFPIELKQLELSGDESAPSNSGVHQVANEQIGSGSPKALSSTGAVRSAAIRLSCPACSCLMEVPPSAAGMQALCPQCNQLLEIPSDPRPDDGRTQANSASQPGSDKGNNPFLAPSPAPLRTSTKTVAPSQAPPSTQAARPLRKPESASEPTTFAPSGSNDFFGQDFGDLDNALPTNAYLAPTMASQDSWLVPIAGLVNRNLSFSNAFSLLFERSFPACLIAPALFLNAALFAMGLIYLAGLIVEQAGELSANRRLLAVGVSLILSVPIWTATVCMTCNTALSALRQRELPASVLFGTGKIYGGVLILMIGWTLLLAAQLFLPSLVAFGFTSIGLQHLAGVSAIGILVLLVILQLAVQMFFGFTPFAMLDGHGFLGSVQISLSICGRNFLTVLGTTICGWLLFTAIAFVSCGVGAVLLIGIMFFLQAAMYLLARGDG